MKNLWLFLLLPFLTQCSSSNSDSKPLPVLSSPARAKAWDEPKVVQTDDGYEMIYRNPSNPREKIKVVGSRKMMPYFVYPPNIKGTKVVNGVSTEVSEAQMWNQTKINGTSVGWYQSFFPSSTRLAVFRTIGVRLKSPTGGSGHYKVEVDGTKNQMRSWLSELRFSQ